MIFTAPHTDPVTLYLKSFDIRLFGPELDSPLDSPKRIANLNRNKKYL